MVVTLDSADAKVQVGNKNDNPEVLVITAHGKDLGDAEPQRIEVPAGMASAIFRALDMFLAGDDEGVD